MYIGDLFWAIKPFEKASLKQFSEKKNISISEIPRQQYMPFVSCMLLECVCGILKVREMNLEIKQPRLVVRCSAAGAA